MVINKYSIMVILLMTINKHSINGYWWLFLLRAINSYSIGGYYINGYQQLLYWWLFY